MVTSLNTTAATAAAATGMFFLDIIPGNVGYCIELWTSGTQHREFFNKKNQQPTFPSPENENYKCNGNEDHRHEHKDDDDYEPGMVTADRNRIYKKNKT